jgi:hypothetical protein
MVRGFGFALALGISWYASGQAWALDGTAVLNKVDDMEYSASDSTAVVKMELIDQDGTSSIRKLQMFQKGNNKRLIKFLEPADVKGMAFLDSGEDKMYLYLPAMHKIRRIAGHVKNDSFAGTDFSFDDLSSERFSSRVLVKQATESAEHYTLELVPRPDSKSHYGKLVMRVRKSDFLFDQLDFYDKTGAVWKKMVRKDFRPACKSVQSYWAQIEDVKKQHRTRNLVESIECDKGLSDKFFSKRQLKR